MVHSNLRIVGFYLAEIRIDGRVQGEGVTQDHLGVEPKAGVVLLEDLRDSPRRRVQKARSREEAIRNELYVSSRRDVADPLQVTTLTCPTRIPAVSDVRPRVKFIVALDEAPNDDAPGLLRCVGEA